jgi:RHS repeat-associated protein
LHGSIAATGGAITHYLQVQGQVLAQYDSGTWGYVAPDALGSVRQVVDPAGAVTLAQSYDPFGNLLTSAGSGSSVFGYTGEQVDASTGLVYLRARYYSSYLNRFVSPDTIIPDPAQPQKWNRYAYAENNPVNLTDPSGLLAGPRYLSTLPSELYLGHSEAETFAAMMQRQADRFAVTTAVLGGVTEGRLNRMYSMSRGSLWVCALNTAFYGMTAGELSIFASKLKAATAEALQDVPISEELELAWSANGPMVNIWSLRRYGGPLTHVDSKLIYNPVVVWIIDVAMREGVQHLPPELIWDLFPPEPPKA